MYNNVHSKITYIIFLLCIKLWPTQRKYRLIGILCAYRTMRWCYKTVTVGGVTIPKGVLVVFPVNYIHHMAQYWPDPYKFDPERYIP